jgi:hypothetical protein
MLELLPMPSELNITNIVRNIVHISNYRLICTLTIASKSFFYYCFDGTRERRLG